ncbi:MAG: mandelate racemase/muconate lactonizing enzyme family protein, partial [Fimbriimonadales bacterium]|nr:mandelate racemase/muconate lactonizing enzyme family protein [Fimbriimonadales bacterium]
QEGFRKDVEMARAVRRAGGDGYRLMFDAFCSWTGPYAVQMCQALEEVRPFWVEEPLPPEDLASWERLRRSTSVPLAAGEHLHSRRMLLPFLREGLVDVLQCDPEWAGGITEMQAILHTAGAFGVPVYPHGHTLLPAIHLAAAHPPSVLPMVEHLLRIQPERYALFAAPPVDLGGRFALPDRPGLGVELREA